MSLLTALPPAGARLYLRPIWFADTPVGLADGTALRLAGGLLWFEGVEALWIAPDGARGKAHVPVAGLADWRARLPDDLAERAATLLAALTAVRAPLHFGERVLRFDQPQVMGILNMTPDSFSDGGRLIGDPDKAADAGFALQVAGVAIVDIGGESTRPGAKTVWEGDEIDRIVPVIERLARSGVIVSVDTRKAAVMEAALAAGAHMVNDVTALTYDSRALEVVAAAGCPVALMHVPSSGEDPHGGKVDYRGGSVSAGLPIDCAIFDWLAERIAACEAAGIPREKIIVDPGIGFGKALADDTRIVNQLALFQGLGVPVLFGASRKRMVGALSNAAPIADRLGGSLALALAAFNGGAQIVRVHDGPETVQAARIWRGLRDAALVAG